VIEETSRPTVHCQANVSYFCAVAARCQKLHSLYLSTTLTQSYQVALNELVVQRLSKRSRRALNNDTSSLESRNLGVGIALSSTDNGASVSHSPARRRRDAGNEADNGLVGRVVLLQEVGGVLLSRTANLANHDDAVRLLVLKEHLEAVDEVGAGEGVAADADDERLAKAGLGGLVHGFVGEGAGAGDDADAAALVDEAGHDADLALALCGISGVAGSGNGRVGVRERLCQGSWGRPCATCSAT
jgi:hypothetical protein